MSLLHRHGQIVAPGRYISTAPARPTPSPGLAPHYARNHPLNQRLLGVLSILGLFKDQRTPMIHNIVGDFDAAMGGEAMKKDAIRVGKRKKTFVDLIALEIPQPLRRLLFLAD